MINQEFNLLIYQVQEKKIFKDYFFPKNTNTDIKTSIKSKKKIKNNTNIYKFEWTQTDFETTFPEYKPVLDNSKKADFNLDESVSHNFLKGNLVEGGEQKNEIHIQVPNMKQFEDYKDELEKILTIELKIKFFNHTNNRKYEGYSLLDNKNYRELIKKYV